jgi:hypothetical protein
MLIISGEELSKKQAAQEAQIRKLRAQVYIQRYVFHFYQYQQSHGNSYLYEG